ncbi:helix-turn-helix domain-containing protein [Nocardioides sp.]|uniref:winged helix-turn-helix transcriptional regulator n=1 Tax=Nocardioides sp. TaxID=35761 RepID=UPI002721462A|nr:helix-turn-helix domain-containing protein [Nocardioides sp.]MDO9457583.1 helix-turn-helix domain-containing protein [Nocardioides sp.]
MSPTPQKSATEHEPRACDAALERAFSFLGKRWNGVLLGTLIQAPAGFAELKRSLGISDSMLSDRLGELTRAGLVARTVDEGPPLAVLYTLTDSGQAILPALHELSTWARDNLTAEQCSGQHPSQH